MNDPAHALITTPAMTAIFSAETHIRRLLEFEAALAQAEARAGVIPAAAAAAIARVCLVENIDITELYRAAGSAGTIVIPLVQALTSQLEDEPRKYIHWGATSQDAIDTAIMLQMRAGLDQLIDDLLAICASCAALATAHRQTLMAGRTLLQQALPIPFGLKAARWLALTTRQVQALWFCRKHQLALQFGGAAGTLAAFGDQGLEVARLLGDALGLQVPELPWHTERDRVAQIAAALGVVAGATAKIAQDVVLLAQSEVGEVSEASAEGKGGSSAMPQKRNPVDATFALASARMATGQVPVVLTAMVQEHERAVGGWQAEWAAIPELFCATAGAVGRVRSVVAGLQVDTEQMHANLEQSGGLLMAEAVTMALAAHIGRPEAQRHVKQSIEKVQAGISFRQALHDDSAILALLGSEGIDQALDPARYLGSANALIDNALRAYQQFTSDQ